MKSLTQMSRLALVMLGAVAGLAFAAPTAFAQDDDIVVTPPYTIHRERTGRGVAGAPTETVTMSRPVVWKDLNLRQDAGVNELYRRIEYTARVTCDDLDDIVDDSLTTDRECIRGAIRSAEPQARAVIADARY